MVYRNHWLAIYSWVERGLLPNPGGVLDQPAKLVEACSVIAEESARKLRDDIPKS